MSINDVKQQVQAAIGSLDEALSALQVVAGSLAEAGSELRSALDGGAAEKIGESLTMVSTALQLLEEGGGQARAAAEAAGDYVTAL